MIHVDGLKARLSEITESDARNIIRLRNDMDINRFLSSSTEISYEQQIAWIRENQKRGDSYYFKITNFENSFFGTISIYNVNDGSGEFGRFISINPLLAIESEYLILKFGFNSLSLKRIYCKTIAENKAVWSQHYHFGFVDEGEPFFEEKVNGFLKLQVITAEMFARFDYSRILRLVAKFK
jgi:RimJ/RimL family protein N-acetyltransferase